MSQHQDKFPNSLKQMSSPAQSLITTLTLTFIALQVCMNQEKAGNFWFVVVVCFFGVENGGEAAEGEGGTRRRRDVTAAGLTTLFYFSNR